LDVLSFKSIALLALGLNDQASRVREEVRTELMGHQHPPTIAMLTWLTVVGPEFRLGNVEACERLSAELVGYCAEHKVEHVRLLGVRYHACARAMREPTEENIGKLRAAIDDQHRSGGWVSYSFLGAQLAEALLISGDGNAAEAALREAFAFVEQSGERYWLADLHRLDGQIALKQPEPDQARAEASFLQAIDIARSQEARLLELRSATDLVGLWRDIGSSDDPRALLDPILASIEGGESTRDVRNARALLAEIPLK
jgi:hypothetical protein